IVPGTWWVRPAAAFGTWDRMIVPWPFARLVFAFEEPMRVPADVTDADMGLRDELTPPPRRRPDASAGRVRGHGAFYDFSSDHSVTPRRCAVDVASDTFPTHVARAIRSLAFVVLCLASLELAARLFWRSHGVPFAHPERVLQAYYPGLAKIDQRNPKW